MTSPSVWNMVFIGPRQLFDREKCPICWITMRTSQITNHLAYQSFKQTFGDLLALGGMCWGDFPLLTANLSSVSVRLTVITIVEFAMVEWLQQPS